MFSRLAPRASVVLRQPTASAITASAITASAPAATVATRALSSLARRPRFQAPLQTRLLASHTPALVRWASSKTTADEAIEEITELYATARDEFEIASEETENNTVYAEEDRVAAREELEKVKAAYNAVVEGADRDVADEVKRRIGQRVRELEHGVAAMEEAALHQD